MYGLGKLVNRRFRSKPSYRPLHSDHGHNVTEQQQEHTGPSPAPLRFDGQDGIPQSTILSRKATDNLCKSHLGLH